MQSLPQIGCHEKAEGRKLLRRSRRRMGQSGRIEMIQQLRAAISGRELAVWWPSYRLTANGPALGAMVRLNTQVILGAMARRGPGQRRHRSY